MQQREGAKRSATAEWQRLRRRVLDRDGHRCTCCGKTEAQLKVEGNALEVHHRDGDHENNALPNLTALCRTPCHRQIVQPAVRRTRLARAVHPQGDRGA